MGKTVNGNYTISITTNGTAANDVRFTLPVTAFSGINTAIGSGYESAASGTMNQINLLSSTQGFIVTYAFGYPGANGYTLRGTFTYEAA